MSKLEKSAWFNLGLGTLCTLFSMLCFVGFATRNAKGIDYIFIILFTACLTAPVAFILCKKKGYEAGFDEREKMISERAFKISAFGLMVFLGLICIIPFFVVGGGNVVKVLYLPLIFFSTLFAAQFIYSVAILIQCVLEEENG
jgi:hypothetical protein